MHPTMVLKIIEVPSSIKKKMFKTSGVMHKVINIHLTYTTTRILNIIIN